MPPRHLIPALGIGALAVAGLGAACLPWRVATPGAARFVSRGLEPYGLSLTAEGATHLSLLPLPHLRFSRTRLAATPEATRPGATGPGAAEPVQALAEGGRLTIELSLLALLSGQAEIGGVALDGARIAPPRSLDDPRWAEPLARISARLAQGVTSHPRRVTVTRATLAGPDRDPEGLDLVLSWPLWSASLDGAGTLRWKGESARFALTGLRPTDFLAGRPSPFAATAQWPAGSLETQGSATLAADGLKLSGEGRFETRSLPETLAYLGRDVALSPFIEGFALDGRFEASRSGLMLPSLRVSVGSNVLEGAGSASFQEARTAVQATLAADSLNLSPLVGGLVRLFGPGAPEPAGSPASASPSTASASPASPSPEAVQASQGPAEGASREAPAHRPIALKPLTGGDLDLRLSAGSSRIGPVLLEDLAASVLVRGDSIEASLGRASLQGAVLKGRIALAPSEADEAETEVKAQGAFDRLDLGALLIDLGQSRWVLGGTQGQFALESVGRDVAALTERVSGRAVLASEGGLISGLDLADVIHRGRLAPGALARRNGRTPFERAGISLRFADGVGEIGEGFLKAAALTASLRGQVSLVERRFRARAELAPRVAGAPAGGEAPRAGALFEIAGPWDAVSIRPARRDETAPDPGGRGGSVPGPEALRPAPAGLPAAVRAYAP
ncbi:AsmA family protein [Methylobacterium planeticum]|uniref:AsmA family protein n=1 Tax=Methylobacterium planeticum TaxID=2615211 RepID=A0A6N6MLG8_9HYPH|nr:AsmA family protein [Methylobacterium planeticum]KAB1070572.1 AsmA family protein [Methylobacterium planeticum]